MSLLISGGRGQLQLPRQAEIKQTRRHAENHPSKQGRTDRCMSRQRVGEALPWHHGAMMEAKNGLVGEEQYPVDKHYFLQHHVCIWTRWI